MWLPDAYYEASWELAQAIGCNVRDIRYALRRGPFTLYVERLRPKSDGGYRIIRIPLGPLYGIQRAIAKNVLTMAPVSPIAHAYVRGRSTMSNAEANAQSRSLFAVDLADAFGQTSFRAALYRQDDFGYPYWDANEFGLSQEALRVVAALIESVQFIGRKPSPAAYGRILFAQYPERRYCFQRGLPQGAPSSPAAFNYACRHLDSRLGHLAENVGGAITRYSDNIYFSLPTPEIPAPLRHAVLRQVEKSGFRINREKLRYVSDGNRAGRPLRVAGISLIDGEPRLSPRQRDAFRMAAFCAGKSGDPGRYAGIKGYAIHVYAELPPRLRGVYAKAFESNSECPDQ